MYKYARLLSETETIPKEMPFFASASEDLYLEEIISAMSNNDKNIADNCRKVFRCPLTEKEAVLYREEGVRDAISHPKAVVGLYNLASETLTDVANFRYQNRQQEKSPEPDVMVNFELGLLSILCNGLSGLRNEISRNYTKFTSRNFKAFADDFLAEYDERFADFISERVKNAGSISEGAEIQISASIGNGLKMQHFLLNELEEYREKHKYDLVDSLFNSVVKKDELQIAHSETAVLSDCYKLRNAGLRHLAEEYRRIFGEIYGYFENLRNQLAFFYGAINLYAKLANIQCATCFPNVEDSEFSTVLAEDLYDIHLALNGLKTPVPNSLTKENASVYLITGTNNGGKTVFLRSVGVAVLMAQAGLFVPAKSMKTGIFKGIYTLFSKENRRRLDSARLEEELGHLSKIIDCMERHSLILLNETFAGPEESESVEIASEVVRAFSDNAITCFFVTHIYSFAKKLYEEEGEHTAFMQAGKDFQGQRTYTMAYGTPEDTGYGTEIYRDILGNQ